MKGVVLAGGLGTRLYPLTKITNKHLLPVYDQPMILYPLETLKRSGITDIMIVCGREHAGHFMQFLGSGKEYGVQLSYALQDVNNGGIADALSYAEAFAENGPIAVILGDNIFECDFKKAVNKFKNGAAVFFKKVKEPKRFGVPVFSKDGKKIVRVEEKPKKPKSSYAQTGFYIFDATVFSIIKTIKPSARGELEMTDVINQYIQKEFLTFNFVKKEWMDAGTFESLFRAATFVRSKRL
ncbi:MAG: sugar phosphate nucleotidyltransferase [Candidatus Kaiserbacteria bacterium]|nr:sugar phosphate nucleotidyltransferase [Candidatus Kaiserbacteria bacterium]